MRSQSLGTLDTMERIMGGLQVPGTDRGWVKDKDYYSMCDGGKDARLHAYTDVNGCLHTPGQGSMGQPRHRIGRRR